MQNAHHPGKCFKRCGFTLIELLVVLLILAILMAVAMPLYLTAVLDTQKKTCRANMQTIANAAVSARIRMGAKDFTTILATNRNAIDIRSADALIGALVDLNAVPVCPNKGTYVIRRGNTGDNTTFKVRCRGTSHGSFQPGLDFN